MPESVGQVLAQHARRPPATLSRPRLLIAGAGGVLGGEVARRFIGSGRFSQVLVLLHEPMQVGLRGVTPLQVPAALQQPHDGTAGGAGPAWPEARADAAIVMFEPPRAFYERERAFWTPTPQVLPALAGWLRAAGVRDLMVLTPHQSGRLPQALQQGLANLDEAAVAALGFERVLLLRAASAPRADERLALLPRVARAMLGIFRYMIPTSQLPLRAVQLAQVAEAALALAPPGVHVLGPATLHAAAQGEAGPVLRAHFGLAEPEAMVA